MFKLLIAGVTALSLTFSTAAPVQAGGLSQDDIGKIIFGIAALAAAGRIIENTENRNRVEATRSQHPQIQSQPNRKVLPRQCLRSFETRFGPHRMFGAHCLRNNYGRANQLPRSCAVRIFTSDGPRRGFDPACLRSQGYSARR